MSTNQLTLSERELEIGTSLRKEEKRTISYSSKRRGSQTQPQVSSYTGIKFEPDIKGYGVTFHPGKGIWSELTKIKDISEFEDRVEEIRDKLLDKEHIITVADLSTFERTISHLDTSRIVAFTRILGVLLEDRRYCRIAASIIHSLLRHENFEVRYTALEAIEFALGEVEIANRLRNRAKRILKNEPDSIVREYLESL